jgi:hypothetical protein
VIAFKDGNSGAWKILGSFDNSDSESSLDMDRQVAFFKAHVTDTSTTSARENYATLGKWLLLDGRISEARAALNSAQTASTERSALGERNRSDHDPIRDLQVKVLLEVIYRITTAPKAGG